MQAVNNDLFLHNNTKKRIKILQIHIPEMFLSYSVLGLKTVHFKMSSNKTCDFDLSLSLSLSHQHTYTHTQTHTLTHKHTSTLYFLNTMRCKTINALFFLLQAKLPVLSMPFVLQGKQVSMMTG